MVKQTKVLCDASEEKGRLCFIEGHCKNSGAEYEVILSAIDVIDPVILCKGCMKKLKKDATANNYNVYVTKL